MKSHHLSFRWGVKISLKFSEKVLPEVVPWTPEIVPGDPPLKRTTPLRITSGKRKKKKEQLPFQEENLGKFSSKRKTRKTAPGFDFEKGDSIHFRPSRPDGPQKWLKIWPTPVAAQRRHHAHVEKRSHLVGFEPDCCDFRRKSSFKLQPSNEKGRNYEARI